MTALEITQNQIALETANMMLNETIRKLAIVTLQNRSLEEELTKLKNPPAPVVTPDAPKAA